MSYTKGEASISKLLYYKTMNNIRVSTFSTLLCLSTLVHTTIMAQQIDSAQKEPSADYFKPVKIKNFIVPAAFLGYGFAALHNPKLTELDRSTNAELREDHPSFAFPADNYLRYAPAVAVYALDLAGIKSKHNFVDRTALLLISGAISTNTSDYLKGAVHRLRPNGSNYRSFPSGHSSMAFMTAEFFHQEYGDRSIWYSVAGYAAATATGTLRLYNGAHWFSDVVAGAGIGIASTRISYLIYPYLKKAIVGKKAQHTTLIPTWTPGNTGLVFVSSF